MNIFIVVAIVILLVVADYLVQDLKSPTKKKGSYRFGGGVGVPTFTKSYKDNYKRKSLLTQNEHEFFGRLRRALPEYLILPQVSMGAIMDVHNYSRKDFYYLRRKFSQKIIDFVVYSPVTNEIVAIIELDDASHHTKKDADADRDLLLSACGYVSIRWESKNKPSESEIALAIKNIVSI